MKKIFVALFIVSAMAITITSCTKDESYTISPCDHDGRTQTATISRTTGVIVKKTVMTSPANASEGSKATYEDRYYIQMMMGGWGMPMPSSNAGGGDLYPCNLPVEFQRANLNVEFEGYRYEQTPAEKSSGVVPISLGYIAETQVVRGGC